MQQEMLLMSLEIIGDNRSTNLKDAKIERVLTRCGKRKNHNDHFIFIMRHMETFMAIRGQNSHCGLHEEGEYQNWQLKMLRCKYLTKILLSDVNEKKEWVLKEVGKFAKLTKAQVLEIYKNVDKIKETRLNNII